MTTNLTKTLIMNEDISEKVKYPSMSKIQELKKLANDKRGYLTSEEITANGFSREYLRYLVRRGFLEQSCRGVYIFPGELDDIFLNAQTNYKKGIFSFGTALFLLNLSNHTPASLEMTFPSGYNLSSPKGKGIDCHSIKRNIHCLGICELKSPNGNLIKAYSAERTLCEILVKRNCVDSQVITDAFKMYAASNKKNLYELYSFSKLFGVREKVSSYMEVLL